jgi:long-subunit acyl-CoA synthetase (AMP-forming)
LYSTPSEQLHQLSHSGVTLIFTSATLLPNLQKAFELAKSQGKRFSVPDSHIVLLEDRKNLPKPLQRYTCISELGGEAMDPERFENGQEHETAIMCYSSGTVSI